MLYKRLCRTLADHGTFIPKESNLVDYVIDCDVDWYTSLYDYNEDQYDVFQVANTISGMNNVTGTRLCWDFDSINDLESARQDAVVLIQRLLKRGVQESEILICWSGKKGFYIELETTTEFTPKQFKSIVFNLAEGLGFDRVVNNAARIIRVIATKHQDSGLYKIPLTLEQLSKLEIEEIKKLASSLENIGEFQMPDQCELPKSILDLKGVDIPEEEYMETTKLDLDHSSLDWYIKPKFLTNCRWALQNGFFKEGQRSNMFTVLAATYKNLGYDQEITYRMLKGVASLQAKRNNTERFSDEELFNNVIRIVYGPHWRNGQYSCREPGNPLYDYCQSLDEHKCNHTENDELKPLSVISLKDSFKEYVKHIEGNTIITGIPSIDKHVFLSTGCNCGIIGSSGSGKSSITLNILANTSQMGVKSVFASLDMAKNRMFEKICYKVSGLPREELYRKFRDNEEGEILERIKEEFGNVNFFNKSCPTVTDLREYILNCQEKEGEKVKLVMVDYFERVTVDMDDETSASKRVSGELQDLVNDLDVCLVTIVQPNKAALSGGIDSPIYDYTSIKGSSFIYQSFRIIMSLWRPFYNPHTFERDKFMQMAVLKNDLGELKDFIFKWDGKRGLISELGPGDDELFKQWKDERDEERKSEQAGLRGQYNFGNKKQSLIVPVSVKKRVAMPNNQFQKIEKSEFVEG